MRIGDILQDNEDSKDSFDAALDNARVAAVDSIARKFGELERNLLEPAERLQCAFDLQRQSIDEALSSQIAIRTAIPDLEPLAATLGGPSYGADTSALLERTLNQITTPDGSLVDAANSIRSAMPDIEHLNETLGELSRFGETNAVLQQALDQFTEPDTALVEAAKSIRSAMPDTEHLNERFGELGRLGETNAILQHALDQFTEPDTSLVEAATSMRSAISDTEHLNERFGELDRFGETNAALQHALDRINTPDDTLIEAAKSIHSAIPDTEHLAERLGSFGRFGEIEPALRQTLDQSAVPNDTIIEAIRSARTTMPETGLVAGTAPSLEPWIAETHAAVAQHRSAIPSVAGSVHAAALPVTQWPSERHPRDGRPRDTDEPSLHAALAVIGLHVPHGGAPDPNVIAYMALYKLEAAIRQFVEEELEKAHGRQWEKYGISGHLRKKWWDKQGRDAAAGGTDGSLLSYADLDDYRAIIVQRDNWSRAFGSAFGSKESVQESFRRLQPLRNAVAHMRDITRRELVEALVEIQRLLEPIRYSD
ncbi:Swt1 family HEPN domain-containing protein [Arhodomonas sp. AD133]|uniref:Swt1 family HEPN domain-containing protein n=1 Tax=Arhodomonas sp. AD133 TaxID=3415009 RepID=UPI003EB7020B